MMATILGALVIVSSLTLAKGADATDEELTSFVEGPVDIVVGYDPDQFSVGWSDGVCYLPVTNARIGDTVQFQFFQHNIYKMPSRDAMERCDFSDATLLSSSGPYEYPITSSDYSSDSKSIYFACEIGSHCFGEQRLEIDLSSIEENAPRATVDLPLSRFVLGTSSDSCAAVRRGDISADVASRMDESECSPPEYRNATSGIDRPHYFRSCLGPPITLTPGGVINQASVLSFPFPTDRRVLLGTRIWEFVQGDIGALSPVYVNQLYIHHIAGSVVLGNGAENIRQSEEDAAFPMPYGILTGELNDRMIFHLIDLRETGDQWLECLECRCQDGEGAYLGSGGSGSEAEGGPAGGISCCTNCTDLAGPTVDYRLRYNVTYTEFSDISTPIEPLQIITADVAPAIGGYVEWDVLPYQDLPTDQVLEGNPKVQVLTRTASIRDLFGGFFFGGKYTGSGLMKLHRCVGHLHIGALGMWMYDDQTNELLCENKVTYGDDPETDKGFIKSIGVTNYQPPREILADRKVRLITHYDAQILHTGVMGLLQLVVSDGDEKITQDNAKLNADMCAAPSCNLTQILPNGGCRDSLEDSIVCQFGGLCNCDDLLQLSDTIGGCNGIYMSSFGNMTVGSLCAQHCGCGEKLLEDSVVEQIEEQAKSLCKYAGKRCTRYLANVYACSQPWVEGSDEFEETVTNIVARRGKKLALEGTKLGNSDMHRFDRVMVEDMEISQCDPNDYPVRPEFADEGSASTSGGVNFHPFYLFPIVVVGLIVGLAVYAKKARSENTNEVVEFQPTMAAEEA